MAEPILYDLKTGLPLASAEVIMDGALAATSEKDEYCAIQGIKAAGLAAAPAEPDEAWKESGL